ncbi:myb/SANT-like DNA-binding domain-containing protein 7 [Eublepharis macularius]|uniref:Myb/SANT-like DNA-binding domain-containing protein 7 n=1 Tax=Eublepharis macularius TaxID=481883 RepID=A0AA97KRZ7_EUBMA|nr:myb/SANT-like DNA-binding domain-containing protein 7 [Eublepharis macularius]
MAAPKSSGGRGVSWREKETLDLLEFWGEEKVQEALTNCHRNIDVFDRIAEQMVSRGHARTALECRTKTKALRQEYKRVVAHNGRSGNAPATCPFYAQLARIFRGDASIRPQRVVRSLQLQSAGHEKNMNPNPSLNGNNAIWEGSEELFTHPMVTLNLQEVHTAMPSDSGSPTETDTSTDDGSLNSGQACEEDPTTDDQDMTQIEDFPEVLGQELEDAQGVRENPQEEERPMATTAQLSPATRLEKARTRTRRVSLLTSVAEKMLSQAQREDLQQRQERRQLLEATTHWRSAMDSETRWHEDIIMEAKEDRRAFVEAQNRNAEGLNKAVTALYSLTELFVKEQRAGAVPASIENSPSNRRQIRHPEVPLRKRAWVIKKRERFDPSC